MRPCDCAAIGGPTISRVDGCINDEQKECIICQHSTCWDLTESPFWGFGANCPHGPVMVEEVEPPDA
jgi:hypothetical protein